MAVQPFVKNSYYIYHIQRPVGVFELDFLAILEQYVQHFWSHPTSVCKINISIFLHRFHISRLNKAICGLTSWGLSESDYNQRCKPLMSLTPYMECPPLSSFPNFSIRYITTDCKGTDLTDSLKAIEQRYYSCFLNAHHFCQNIFAKLLVFPSINHQISQKLYKNRTWLLSSSVAKISL